MSSECPIDHKFGWMRGGGGGGLSCGGVEVVVLFDYMI